MKTFYFITYTLYNVQICLLKMKSFDYFVYFFQKSSLFLYKFYVNPSYKYIIHIFFSIFFLLLLDWRECAHPGAIAGNVVHWVPRLLPRGLPLLRQTGHPLLHTGTDSQHSGSSVFELSVDFSFCRTVDPDHYFIHIKFLWFGFRWHIKTICLNPN